MQSMESHLKKKNAIPLNPRLDKLSKIRSHIPNFRNEISTGANFAKFYKWSFDYVKEHDIKSLSTFPFPSFQSSSPCFLAGFGFSTPMKSN